MDLYVLSCPPSYSLPELINVYILTRSRTLFGYELWMHCSFTVCDMSPMFSFIEPYE